MNLAIAQDIARRRDECRRAIAELSAKAPTAGLIRKTRDEFGAELAGRLLAVAEIQPKARRKFGEGFWWATDRSLQQATPRQVAALKATWLGDGDAYDLCCGIGGDAMQLAARGRVIAIDCDPLMAEMARSNLSRLPSSHQVFCEDVINFSLPTGCRLHIDPDRRVESRRTSQPEHYQPGWSDVLRLVAGADAALVKLAPAARIGSVVQPAHRAWISLAGSVREQTLICGDALQTAAVEASGVSAWIVKSDSSVVRFTGAGEMTTSAASADSPQSFLIDPDAAIRASGLTEAFAAHHQLRTLAGPAGFLTGEEMDAQRCAEFGMVQRVVWSGPADDRKIRRELRARDSYPVTIKVRGADHDPASLTKRYRKCGTQPVCLWIGRSKERTFAAATEPLDS